MNHPAAADSMASPTLPQPDHGSSRATLTLGALGVVFGDIGTSPLYALQATLDPRYSLTTTITDLYGICITDLYAPACESRGNASTVSLGLFRNFVSSLFQSISEMSEIVKMETGSRASFVEQRQRPISFCISACIINHQVKGERNQCDQIG